LTEVAYKMLFNINNEIIFRNASKVTLCL
jgi:hypothetical protein